MKKIVLLFIALVLATAVTACSSGFGVRLSVTWQDETTEYKLSVLADDSYSPGYPTAYPDMPYSVKPSAAESGGTFTSRIKRGAAKTVITTSFVFTAAYPSAWISDKTLGEEDGDYIKFTNTITAETSFNGDDFMSPIATEKTVSVVDVVARRDKDGNITYSAPEKLEYTLTAAYSKNKYEYRFDKPLYDFPQSGTINIKAGATLDNEALLYYIRAVNIDKTNYTKVSLSLSVPDPFEKTLSQLAAGIIASSSGAQKVDLDPADWIEGGKIAGEYGQPEKYETAQIVIQNASGRTGSPIILCYAMNDPPAADVSSTRAQQKLISMRQGYIRYDLVKVS